MSNHESEPDASAESERVDKRRRRWPAMLVAVLMGVSIVWFLGPRIVDAATPHLYAGTVLQGSNPAPPLDGLEFANGSPVSLQDFDGQVVMLYFGFTSCGKVCPTTLATASDAVGGLSEADAENVRLIMVSLDPQRDTPQIVHEYASIFHPSFAGAGGPMADVLQVTTRYGIYVSVEDPPDPARPDEYDVDHTSTLMAIDSTGALRVVWAPDTSADAIRADLHALLTG